MTRYIITKQALQEGWDCPFAYVLAVLTNPSSKTALTQLVGRILRQPDGHKTGNRWLDESYVYCFQRRGADLLKEIRLGFGNEGLGDLKGRIIEESGRHESRQRARCSPAKEIQEASGASRASGVHDQRREAMAAGPLRAGYSFSCPVGGSEDRRPVHFETAR